MNANRRTNNQTLDRAEWVAEAVRLSIEGWSCRDIGKAVGRHHSTVAEALAKEFERIRPQPEEVETLRAIQREQIQRQMQGWIPASLAGDSNAAMVVYRFMERAARLDGLDMATKADLKLSGGLTVDATPEEAARLVREAFGEHAAKAVPDADGAPESIEVPPRITGG